MVVAHCGRTVHMGRIYRETELGAQRGTSTRPGAELPAAQVCKQNPDGSRSPRTRGWQFHLGYGQIKQTLRSLPAVTLPLLEIPSGNSKTIKYKSIG